MGGDREILVVEPDRKRAEILGSVLASEGYRVLNARDMGEAKRLAREGKPVLALVALEGPGLEPVRLIKALKKDAGDGKIPVVVLVEKFLEDLVASALKAGAVDYLTWPVDARELVRRVGVHARLQEDDRALAESLTRYEKHFGVSEVGLFFTSKEGLLLECNDELVKMLGYDSKEELLNLDVAETIYMKPEERKRFREAVEREGAIKDFRVTFRRKGGEPVSVLISGHVVRDDAGAVVGYRGENIPLRELERHTPKKGLFAGLLPRLSGGFHSLFSASELMAEHYQRVERLGIGSFGEVWKVRDVEMDPPRFFVAKIPLSKKHNAKFEKEARILETLAGHPGVPKFREIRDERGKMVLIQEFVEGRTLYDLLEREFEEPEVESVVIQLTDVVAHAHRLGIIHRDIKPENVIVRPDGTIKLLDFGTAKELREDEFSDTVVGSRPYMSPEQIMGKSQRRSDVWALGVVMYVLLTGRFPFYHEVEKVLMDMILETPVRPPSRYMDHLDPELEGIIMKCLEKDPENRYKDAGALKEALVEAFPDYGKKILPLY